MVRAALIDRARKLLAATASALLLVVALAQLLPTSAATGDWPKEQRVVWTLITRGRANQAKGWLQPEWQVDKDLIAKNAARDPSLMTNGTNETDLDHENRPPAMTGSPASRANRAVAAASTPVIAPSRAMSV